MSNYPRCEGGCGERLTDSEYNRFLRGKASWVLCDECRRYICPECLDELADKPGAICGRCVEAKEETLQAIRAEADNILDYFALLASPLECRQMARDVEASRG